MLNHEPLRAQDDPFDIDVGEDDEQDGEDEDEDDEHEDEEGGWQVRPSQASGLTLYG